MLAFAGVVGVASYRIGTRRGKITPSTSGPDGDPEVAQPPPTSTPGGEVEPRVVQSSVPSASVGVENVAIVRPTAPSSSADGGNMQTAHPYVPSFATAVEPPNVVQPSLSAHPQAIYPSAPSPSVVGEETPQPSSSP